LQPARPGLQSRRCCPQIAHGNASFACPLEVPGHGPGPGTRSLAAGKHSPATQTQAPAPPSSSPTCNNPVTAPMDVPSAALEHRLSELEGLVGERHPDDAQATTCLCAALRDAVRAGAAALYPDDPERAEAALRRAHAVGERGAAAGAASRHVVADATARVAELERGLRDLALLLPVLDRDWRSDAGGRADMCAALERVRVAAGAAEAVVAEESRAVDELLNKYNAAIATLNSRFMRLVALVEALEEKVGGRGLAT
jgi:hypothetical protein